MPRASLKQRLGRAVIPRLPFSRRTFDILRFECDAMVTRVLVSGTPLYWRRRRLLAAAEGLRVNIGSGGQGREGWVNVDVRRHHHDQSLPWDIRRGLPFRDGQVAMIFAEHVIEHLDFRHDVPRLLRDAHRVLRRGGRVRIIVPDAARWLSAYVTRDPAAWTALGFGTLPDDMPTAMAMINHVFHQDGEHLFAYDYETMRYVLACAGFGTIEQRRFGDAGLPGLDLDQPHHAPYSLYVEGEK